jgi:metallo-beta-lactamase class B
MATMGRPVPPVKIAGNLYYVGANDITVFLFSTPKGLILLDGGFAEMAPQVEKNIQTLGFKLSDVKILLNSQAHFDHAAALAQLKQDTGAKMYAPAIAARELADGGAPDDVQHFTPVETDVIVTDKVELGGFTLHAVATPGHTPGCTTWTAKIDGKDAVFVCSASVVSPLVNNLKYPHIVDDFRKTFAILHALPCDLFLAAHGGMFDLAAKLERPALFVDPKGYRDYVDSAEAAFAHTLKEQTAIHSDPEKR